MFIIQEVTVHARHALIKNYMVAPNPGRDKEMDSTVLLPSDSDHDDSEW